MRAWLTFVFGAGALGSACLLTTSLDGLDDSAATARTDGAPGDGAGEGHDAGDAVAQGDGPVDASTDDSGAPPAFRCSSRVPAPVFCTDFDTGTLSGIIGAPVTALGGQVTLDDTVSRSPLRSMKLTSPATSTAGVGRAQVGRNFGFAPQTSIVVEFDLLLESVDKTASNMVSIGMGSYDLSLFIGGTAKLREGVPGDGALVYTATDRVPPKSGAWVHLSLSIKLANGASTATLAYDGVAQSALPLVIEAYRASAWDIDIGLNYVGGPDDGRLVHIDNLVIDAK